MAPFWLSDFLLKSCQLHVTVCQVHERCHARISLQLKLKAQFYILSTTMSLSGQGKLTGSTLSLGGVTLRVGEKLFRKFRTQYGPDSAGETTEQHEVYEAIQIAKNAKLVLVHEIPSLSEVPAIMA
jgi:hypothetical protein